MKIVLSTVAALLLLGCSGGSDQSSSEEVSSKDSSVVQEKRAVESLVQESKEVAQDVKELAKKSVDVAKESSEKIAFDVQEESEKIMKEMAEDAKKMSDEIQEKSKELLKDMQTTADKSTNEIAEAIAAPTQDVDGALIYKACISCHGAKAEKKALNKSQIIQGWESSKIADSLRGYKDGSYGGPMKGIMKPQVDKLSDAEIDAVAKYISDL